MKRKFLIFLLSVAMVMAAAVPGAYAAPTLDTTKPLTLTLSTAELREDSAAPYKADLTGIEKIPVRLYKVADVSAYGEYSSVAPFDLGDLSDMNAEKWMEKAKAAEAVTQDPALHVSPAVVTTLNTNADRSQLSTGKIAIPSAGMYLVIAEQTQGQRYSFTFDPYIVAVPGNLYYTASKEAPDEWVYDVEAGLKPHWERLPGQLEIVKTLDTYATITGAVSFVFQVEAVDPITGENLYSNVVAMTFDRPGVRSETLKIPVGAEVTVTEVYSGGSYQVVSSPSQTVTVVADQLETPETEHVTVNFTNTNNDKLIPGNGIVNAFSNTADEKNPDQPLWSWKPVNGDQQGVDSAVGGGATAG